MSSEGIEVRGSCDKDGREASLPNIGAVEEGEQVCSWLDDFHLVQYSNEDRGLHRKVMRAVTFMSSFRTTRRSNALS